MNDFEFWLAVFNAACNAARGVKALWDRWRKR
jgi:hypothetical protein